MKKLITLLSVIICSIAYAEQGLEQTEIDNEESGVEYIPESTVICNVPTLDEGESYQCGDSTYTLIKRDDSNLIDRCN
ncbi:TPA: hypothetical protein ACX6RX_003159 [Photobacterium damselae]